MIPLRRAEPADAEALSALALRSKAHWGYDEGFMERCRPLLAVSAAYVRENDVIVAIPADGIVGFCSIVAGPDEVELDMLFVEPAWIGRGVGRALLEHALARAAGTARRMVVESDPQAEEFYARHGGVRFGWRASSVEPGRYLPLLAFDITARRSGERPRASSTRDALTVPPTPVSRLRRLCLALPEAHEVEAWGEPTFRVRNRMFATYAASDKHHGAGRPATWLKAGPGNQALMVRAAPDRFFVPPYVGVKGWIGVWLDGDVDWSELDGLIRDSYRLVAPKKLAALLGNAS